jgi:hypothetical protein
VNVPSILLGLVIATLVGALFFAFRPSRSYRRLGYCILIAWVGFAVGHFTAELIGLDLWSAGAINLGGALPGCLLGLIGWQILSLREWEK